MRLIELSIQNFRGFGHTTGPIKLDGDLLLFFGPNGFGKTSLSEAIEWLFYGATKRRQYGETFSKAEYTNTYANAHNGNPVEVEAIISIGEDRHTLKRQLRQDSPGEESETFIDGTKAAFTSIGITPIEAVYPVVAQNGLQTFIHTKPKDRRDAIGAALGLDELTTLKSALESARLSFKRTPPFTIVNAQKNITAHVNILSKIPETHEIATRWQRSPMKVDPTKDINSLIKAANALSGELCATTEEALAALRIKRAEASKAVFDITKLSPSTTLQTELESFDLATNEAQTSLDRFERALAVVIADRAAAYGVAWLDFWNKGLALAPDGNICPMCEAPTLTLERRTEIQKRLSESAVALANNKELVDAIEAAKKTLNTLRSDGQKCWILGITPAERIHLQQLMIDNSQFFEDFIIVYDKLKSIEMDIKSIIINADKLFGSTVKRLADPTNAPLLTTETTNAKRLLSKATSDFKETLRNYCTQWREFEQLINVRIASQNTVSKIDAVGKTLRSASDLRMIGEYEKILEETQELIRTVESTLKVKQEELFSTRGAEVKTLYDKLNPGALVCFDTMEPGTDQIKLHAKSFGVRMPAAANLSECQLNCLGLSVWLMRATTTASPFGFILLDDPVQSMDDDHAEAFICSVVPHLLDTCNKQVIILSHVKSIVERLRNLNTSRRYRIYHFENFTQSGPVITEQIKIAKLFSEIKGLADGNEANRELGVDRLRVLIELFIRELHLQETKTPLPPEYDRATAKGLLPAFQAIPGTTPDEHSKLRDTVQFADPAHHTQAGYVAPQTANIRPHIDRLETLFKKHGLLS